MRRPLAALVLAATLVAPATAAAFRAMHAGDRLENAELPTADGGRARLVEGDPATVIVFVRAYQPQSERALQIVCDLQRQFVSRVRFVVVVEGGEEADAVLASVRLSGADVPVLLDAGNVLAGRLGVFSVPVAGIVDAQQRLVAAEYFTTVNFADTVERRVAVALRSEPARSVAARGRAR